MDLEELKDIVIKEEEKKEEEKKEESVWDKRQREGVELERLKALKIKESFDKHEKEKKSKAAKKKKKETKEKTEKGNKKYLSILSNSFYHTIEISDVDSPPKYYKNVLHYAYVYEMADNYLANIIYKAETVETAIEQAKQYIVGKKKSDGTRDNPECYESIVEKAIIEAIAIKYSTEKFRNELLSTNKAYLRYKTDDPFLGIGASGKGRNVYGRALEDKRNDLLKDQSEYLTYISNIRFNIEKERVFQRYITYNLILERLNKLDIPSFIGPPRLVISFSFKESDLENLASTYREKYSVDIRNGIYDLYKAATLDANVMAYMKKRDNNVFLEPFLIAKKKKFILETFLKPKGVEIKYPLDTKLILIKEQLWKNYLDRKLPSDILKLGDDYKAEEFKLLDIEGVDKYIDIYSKEDIHLASMKGLSVIDIIDPPTEDVFSFLSINSVGFFNVRGYWYPTIKHYILEQLYNPKQLNKQLPHDWILKNPIGDLSLVDAKKDKKTDPFSIANYKSIEELEGELKKIIPENYKAIYLKGIKKAMYAKFNVRSIFNLESDIAKFLKGEKVELNLIQVDPFIQQLRNRLISEVDYKLDDDLYNTEVNTYLKDIRQILVKLNLYKDISPIKLVYDKKNKPILYRFVHMRLLLVTEIIGIVMKYLSTVAPSQPSSSIEFTDKNMTLIKGDDIKTEPILSISLTIYILHHLFGLCNNYYSLNTFINDFTSEFFKDTIGNIAKTHPLVSYKELLDMDDKKAAFPYKQQIVNLIWIYLGILSSKLPDKMTDLDLFTYINEVELKLNKSLPHTDETIIKAFIYVLKTITKLSKVNKITNVEVETAFSILYSDNPSILPEENPKLFSAITDYFECDKEIADLAGGYIVDILAKTPGDSKKSQIAYIKFWNRINYFALLSEKSDKE